MDATDTIFILLLSYSLFIATTEGTGSVSFTKYKIEMSNMDQAQLPIDLDAMPSHITGTAILHASDGSLVRPCSGKMTEEVCFFSCTYLIQPINSLMILYCKGCKSSILDAGRNRNYFGKFEREGKKGHNWLKFDILRSHNRYGWFCLRNSNRSVIYSIRD